MVIGLIHAGSGIGDQLFSYIATRVRAADLGVDFGFVGKEFFKGASFMNLDWGKSEDWIYTVEEPSGKVIIPDGVSRKGDIWQQLPRRFVLNKPYYDPNFNFIPDDSVIDGYGAQDIRYFEHRLGEVRDWLKVEPADMPDDLCVVNVRGGEYKGVRELYLTKEYWQGAISEMILKGYKIEFHTDDIEAVKDIGFQGSIYKGIETNWRAIRYAKHLIISNSAFAILPALLNENVKEVIAPKFWAGRNVGEWRRPGNYYKKFTYI